jgi:hypothetical protein
MKKLYKHLFSRRRYFSNSKIARPELVDIARGKCSKTDESELYRYSRMKTKNTTPSEQFPNLNKKIVERQHRYS